MPTVAIGDIHGHLDCLEDLLSKVLLEIHSDDTLVFLGDYIDRGPDTRGCVERIVCLKAEAACKVVTLMGNHEQWMLRSLQDPTRHSWLVGMEALDTIRSYSPLAANAMEQALADAGARLFTKEIALPYDSFFNAMPPAHLKFFQQLELFHRSPDVLCVHAGADLDGNLDPLAADTFIWGPPGFPEGYAGKEAVVYGHWHNAIPQEDGTVRPCIGPNRTYGIDSIDDGVLTAMRFPDGRVFQSKRLLH